MDDLNAVDLNGSHGINMRIAREEPPTTTFKLAREQEAQDADAAKHMHPVAHRERQLPLATPEADDGFSAPAREGGGGDMVMEIAPAPASASTPSSSSSSDSSSHSSYSAPSLPDTTTARPPGLRPPYAHPRSRPERARCSTGRRKWCRRHRANAQHRTNHSADKQKEEATGDAGGGSLLLTCTFRPRELVRRVGGERADLHPLLELSLLRLVVLCAFPLDASTSTSTGSPASPRGLEQAQNTTDNAASTDTANAATSVQNPAPAEHEEHHETAQK
ncbi:hypothetical protein C8F04DRAFT_129770 [Mycena alexandri]|uniref:Uncharacterized protein n=1 Tax=Mycena alexandri TaxID=1745969 RepID=A0AAD6T9Z9_9AGAR|nr:hypothetical protein C8F04DRAFT_129770 [Mycena alexandri]